MKIIDLTQPITQQMPVYPGTEQPVFSSSPTLAKDGFCETYLQMVSHTGTHLDAPGHMFAGGATLDQLPIDQFCGMGVIIDVTSCQEEISLDIIEPYGGKMRLCQFVILKTGYDRYWGKVQYFDKYPLLTAQAAKYIADQQQIVGVGIDAISFDKIDSSDFPVHKTLLSTGKILIENLTNLGEIGGNIAMFSVLPLKYLDADGSPVRAVAFQPPPGIFCPC